jgi:exodeoxyribonuclease-3
MIRLLSYNIRFGGTGREAPLAEVIREANPDVVVFQEASDPRVVARLALATGLGTWGAQPGYSTGFMSRVPVAEYTWRHPAGARHPVLDLLLGDRETRIFGLHLSARFSKWSERRRRREIGALLDGIREQEHGFHVLVGDFNALAPGERLEAWRMPAWIQALVWVSGRDIARDTIQAMLDAGYVDMYRALHPKEPGHSFPTWGAHVRLDYVFTPAAYAQRVVECDVGIGYKAAAAASDHYPLLSVLDVG